jgi:hypothetical protein
VKPVEGKIIPHPTPQGQKDTKANAHAKQIDQSNQPVSPKIPQGTDKIVTYHSGLLQN